LPAKTRLENDSLLCGPPYGATLSAAPRPSVGPRPVPPIFSK